MAANEKFRDAVPEAFETLEQAAEFWETRDLTEYEDIWQPVEIQVRLNPSTVIVNLEPHLAERVSAFAQSQHISTESLVNRVLEEYLEERAA